MGSEKTSVTLVMEPCDFAINLERTALLLIDMQRDFLEVRSFKKILLDDLAHPPHTSFDSLVDLVTSWEMISRRFRFSVRLSLVAKFWKRLDGPTCWSCTPGKGTGPT